MGILFLTEAGIFDNTIVHWYGNCFDNLDPYMIALLCLGIVGQLCQFLGLHLGSSLSFTLLTRLQHVLIIF